MNPLDDELRSALRPRDPRPGFSRRVLARIEAESAQKASSRPWLAALAGVLRLPRVRWATTAVACLALAIGVVEYRRYQRVKTEGEIARAQVMLALHIASDKLNVALGPVHQVEGEDVARVPKSRSNK